MKKFIAVYGAGGYDGDDDYCWGNSDVLGVKDTRAEAEELIRKDAEDYVNVEVEGQVGASADQDDRAMAMENISVYDNLGTEGTLEIEVTDDMFPKHYIARIVEIDV